MHLGSCFWFCKKKIEKKNVWWLKTYELRIYKIKHFRSPTFVKKNGERHVGILHFLENMKEKNWEKLVVGGCLRDAHTPSLLIYIHIKKKKKVGWWYHVTFCSLDFIYINFFFYFANCYSSLPHRCSIIILNNFFYQFLLHKRFKCRFFNSFPKEKLISSIVVLFVICN